MLNRQKENTISGNQLSLLIMGYLFGDAAISSASSSAGRDAWLAYIVGWGGGILLLWMYSKISSSNQGQTFQALLKGCFGKPIAFVIGLLYVGYFIHLSSLVISLFGEYMAITIYYETPVFFIIAIFGLVIAYSVRSGLQILGRTAEMLMPYLFIFVIVIFVLLWKEYDLQTMLPILEHGIGSISKEILGIWTYPFGEAVAFLLIFSYYQPEKLTKVALLSGFIMGFIILSIILRDLWSLGPDMLKRVTFPPSMSTELTSGITLDPIIAVNLLIGGWIKISICIYAAVLGITQLLGLKDYKPFVMPVVAIVVLLPTLLYRNLFELLTWWQPLTDYYFVAIFFQIIIPSGILIITLFKNRKRKIGKKN